MEWNKWFERMAKCVAALRGFVENLQQIGLYISVENFYTCPRIGATDGNWSVREYRKRLDLPSYQCERDRRTHSSYVVRQPLHELETDGGTHTHTHTHTVAVIVFVPFLSTFFVFCFVLFLFLFLALIFTHLSQ